jgi:DNA-binding XRE family transcriptional regulator
MGDRLAFEVGSRVRFYRLAGRKTQPVIAGLAGITTDYLYQIERGKKMPTLPVLLALARALQISPAFLLDGVEPEHPVQPTVPFSDALHDALLMPSRAGAETHSSQDLCSRIGAAWRVWQGSPHRYTEIAVLLPSLVNDLEAAVRDEPTRDLFRCAADLYGLVRTAAKRSGRVDLAFIAADRSCHAAEAADDPLRLGVARWNLAHAVMAQGRPEASEDIALHAANELPSADTPDLAAVRGTLLLVASVAAARRGDTWAARDRVRDVALLADRTGERNVLWTAFGPTNVAMHAVSVEAEAGDAVEASHLAASVHQERSPSIERRVAFMIDQARYQQQRADHRSALAVLHATSKEAPEDLARRPLVREILRRLVHAGSRTTAQEAVELAGRLLISLR